MAKPAFSCVDNLTMNMKRGEKGSPLPWRFINVFYFVLAFLSIYTNSLRTHEFSCRYNFNKNCLVVQWSGDNPNSLAGNLYYFVWNLENLNWTWVYDMISWFCLPFGFFIVRNMLGIGAHKYVSWIFFVC
jgi:hypothetical protein